METLNSKVLGTWKFCSFDQVFHYSGSQYKTKQIGFVGTAEMFCYHFFLGGGLSDLAISSFHCVTLVYEMLNNRKTLTMPIYA